jgi:hypothetical protein
MMLITRTRSWVPRAKCDCVARFIVQREGNTNNKYFASIFFSKIHARNAASGPWFTNDQCGKMIVQGTMYVGLNNVIYMELHSGPKTANGTCGKMIVAGTKVRGSTVCIYIYIYTHTHTHIHTYMPILMLQHNGKDSIKIVTPNQALIINKHKN